MRLNLVAKRDAPLAPYPTEMVCVAPDLVPFLFGAMWLRSQKYWWSDAENWRTGRQLLAEQASKMLEGCSLEITNRQDALYALLDASLRGTNRTVTGLGTAAEPYVYSPPIPPTVSPTEGVYPSVLYWTQREVEVSNNAFNGAPAYDLPTTPGLRQDVAAILAALEAGGYDDTQVKELLNLIIVALG